MSASFKLGYIAKCVCLYIYVGIYVICRDNCLLFVFVSALAPWGYSPPMPAGRHAPFLSWQPWSLLVGLAAGAVCCHCKPSPSEPITHYGLKGSTVSSGELLGNVRHGVLVFPPSSRAAAQPQHSGARGHLGCAEPSAAFCPSSSSRWEEAQAAMGAVCA